MNYVPIVEPRGPVTQARITHGEHIERTRPGIVWLDSQSMAPGVIHIELHSAPGFLTEIDLQGVIIPVADIILVASGLARIIRIRLEEVDRIARARVWRAVWIGAG